METAAILVAIGFGALMGFSLGRFLEDLRPVVVGLVFGLLCGGGVWVFDIGADPSFIAGSLLLGCATALVGIGLSRLTRPSGSPSPRW